MKVVHKFPISVDLENTLDVHEGAQVLDIAIQNNQICVWVLHDLDQPKKSLKLIAQPTGIVLKEEHQHAIFVKTLHTWDFMPVLTYVLHYFRLP